MNIFIEPANWDTEANGPKPIAQLDVVTNSYLEGASVRGARAVSESESPCWFQCFFPCWRELIFFEGTLHWAISTSSLTAEQIRDNLAAAKERQFRAWCLPTGVSLREMSERWQALDFGGKRGEEARETAFDPSYFRKPNRQLQELRALARAGRDETEALMAEGRKKVVWGEPHGAAEESIDIPCNAAVAEEEIADVILDDVSLVAGGVSDQELEQIVEVESPRDEMLGGVDSSCSPSSDRTPS